MVKVLLEVAGFVIVVWWLAWMLYQVPGVRRRYERWWWDVTLRED